MFLPRWGWLRPGLPARTGRRTKTGPFFLIAPGIVRVKPGRWEMGREMGQPGSVCCACLPTAILPISGTARGGVTARQTRQGRETLTARDVGTAVGKVVFLRLRVKQAN